MDGEVFVVHAAGTTPDVQVYDTNATAWYTFANIDVAQTFAGTQTFSGTITANGDVTLGSDETDAIVINGAPVNRVLREDFDNVGSAYLTFNDKLVASYAVTDAAHNLIHMPGSDIPFILFRYEQAMAGTCDPFDAGQLTLATCVDDATNDGILLYFNTSQIPDGTLPLLTDFDESDAANNAMYCEAQIDIANISAIDDFWFGWVLNDAIDDPPASADLDTAAIWTISDAAGDIDITTMLNGGAELQDDVGTDWTDNDQFILRVSINADTVTFEGCLLDGCAEGTVATVASPTAILNIDDDDHMICSLGYTAAANEELGLTIEYIEIGRNQ
jgi:hypothetical protein